MDKITPDLAHDRLIMLGDYIDRGYQSYEMIRDIRALQEQYGNHHVILLRGNHEQMAIDYCKYGDWNYLINGGNTTIKSLRLHHDCLENHIEFFQELPLYYEDDYFIYVHAGMKPGISLSRQSEFDLLWIREEFYDQQYTAEKNIIFGHTPTFYIADNRFHPLTIHNKIALDTGCVYGGYLSALEIVDNRIAAIHQAKSRIAC